MDLAAPAGGRFVLAWGAIAAGLAAFARGLRRFLSTGQAFPWKGVLLAGGAPVGILVFIVAVVGFQIEKRRSQRRKVEEDRLEAVYAVRDRQEAERRREAARADQEARAASREKERTDRIERARLSLSSSQPITACDAAGVLEKEGAVEAIPDLVGTVDRVTNALSARNCAAHALVGLGAPDRALDFFKECARLGTPDARTHAAAGFAAIGPRAAEFALPLLREELRSPYQDRRFWAVESLQQLGEAGRELLDTAAADSDATVRDRARQALAAMKPAG